MAGLRLTMSHYHRIQRLARVIRAASDHDFVAVRIARKFVAQMDNAGLGPREDVDLGWEVSTTVLPYHDEELAVRPKSRNTMSK